MESAPARLPEDELKSRLADIERLLGSDPARADTVASRLLEAVPGHPMLRLFQGIARRLAGDPSAAVKVLEPLCRDVPDAPLPHLQLGLAKRAMHDNDGAVEAMRRAVAVRPDFGDAWFALADLLIAMGDRDAADRAFAAYVKNSTRDPAVLEPATALRENRISDAEAMLRSQIERRPNDVAALCVLADVATRQG